MAAQVFGIKPGDYTLYKTDWTEDPSQPLTNDSQTLQKEHIRSGDLLIIRSNHDVGLCFFAV